MRDQARALSPAQNQDPEQSGSNDWRENLRNAALRSALQKRLAGVPTYTVAEAAALLSVSPEHIYRLIQAHGFPALHMRTGGSHGRYVIPAQAVEQMLGTAGAGCLDVAEWTAAWAATKAGGDR